jgi:hypothetical protein
VVAGVGQTQNFRSRTRLLAYNLGNLWRRLALPKRIETWSLTSLQQRLVKTGGRLVKHARYYWLLLAEGHLNRRRFGAMLGRIALLPLPTVQRLKTSPKVLSVRSLDTPVGRTQPVACCKGVTLVTRLIQVRAGFDRCLCIDRPLAVAATAVVLPR